MSDTRCKPCGRLDDHDCSADEMTLHAEPTITTSAHPGRQWDGWTAGDIIGEVSRTVDMVDARLITVTSTPRPTNPYQSLADLAATLHRPGSAHGGVPE